MTSVQTDRQNGGEGTIVRSGVLFKRGKGGLLHRRNWKIRYFELTLTELRYYAHDGGTLKGHLDIRDCDRHSLEIMPTDAQFDGKHATLWRLAIQTRHRRMLIAAASETEMNQWVRAWHTVFAQRRRASSPVRHSDSEVELQHTSARPELPHRRQQSYNR